MENLIERGQSMSEMYMSLTLMIQSIAQDRRDFSEAEMVTGRLVKEAYEYAGSDESTVEAKATKMISIFMQVQEELTSIGRPLLAARGMAQDAADAVRESDARREIAHAKLNI
jgi:hypothetical protein